MLAIICTDRAVSIVQYSNVATLVDHHVALIETTTWHQTLYPRKYFDGVALDALPRKV